MRRRVRRPISSSMKFSTARSDWCLPHRRGSLRPARMRCRQSFIHSYRGPLDTRFDYKLKHSDRADVPRSASYQHMPLVSGHLRNKPTVCLGVWTHEFGLVPDVMRVDPRPPTPSPSARLDSQFPIDGSPNIIDRNWRRHERGNGARPDGAVDAQPR